MSRYAKINSNSIVENVIICEDSQIGLFEGNYIKVTELTRDANIDYFYDSVNNKFISIKPYESWILGEDFNWHAPIGDSPENGECEWNEEDGEWNSLTPGVLKDQTHRWDVELQEWVPLS